MAATKYPHPWIQDQALTDRLLKLVDDEDWDLFGIADVGPLNEKARPGRRPKDLWPTAKLSRMLATSRKGVVGRSQRFLAGEYGAWHTIGLLLTNAPLMGGDYRYPDVTTDLCDGCRACLDACPCGALTEDGYDADRCHEYRDNPDNQERASTYTVMKCMRCMTACDKKRIKDLL